MKIQPLGERVLIKPEQEKEKTEGGIYIPESAKEEKKRGEVVAAGTFENGNDLPVNKGDKVIYGGYSSEDFEMNGEKYIFVEYKDVLAKVE